MDYVDEVDLVDTVDKQLALGALPSCSCSYSCSRSPLPLLRAVFFG